MDPQKSGPEHSAPLLHLEKMGALARLARGMSRDVGELVGAASGSVREALSSLQPGDPAREPLGDAASALQRAMLIARQLEAMAKPAPARSEPRELGSAVAQLLPLVQRLAGSSVSVTASDLDRGAWIAAEAGQLEQVLFHLVVNSRDAMPEGGTITLRVACEQVAEPRSHPFGILAPGYWATLEVRDSGCGMNREVLSRIFEPFFTTKSAGQGSGLGLATVYGIARQLEGQVTVESTPGEGTAVTLWVPAVAAPAGASAAEATPAVVLLVDDDEWVRAVTARALRRAGEGVLEATDAESALALLHDVAGQAVRVVLTDIVMPGMWGDALARRIADERHDVRTVLMTGRSPELLPSGVAGTTLLRKPFSRSQLVAAIAG